MSRPPEKQLAKNSLLKILRELGLDGKSSMSLELQVALYRLSKDNIAACHLVAFQTILSAVIEQCAKSGMVKTNEGRAKTIKALEYLTKELQRSMEDETPA